MPGKGSKRGTGPGWHAHPAIANDGSMTFPVLCDLDGVVWLSHRPIPGSVEAIATLRAAGHRVLFVTNNSFATLAEHTAALERIGIPATGDVLSSASAAALLVRAGERVLVCGGPGVEEAVRSRDAEPVPGIGEAGAIAEERGGPIDSVLVGFHRTFDYEVMRRALAAVIGGARLIATNDDVTYPTPDGPIPGGGAILAGIAAACSIDPLVAGKPYPAMADLVRAVVGHDAAASAVMVGDRPDTDGRFAVALGCRYAQVWSGVVPKGSSVLPVPDLVGDDLSAIVRQLMP